MDQDEFNLLSNNADEVDLAKDLSITPEPEDLENFSHSDNELSESATPVKDSNENEKSPDAAMVDSSPPNTPHDFDDDFVLPDSIPVVSVSAFNGDSLGAIDKEKKKKDQKSRKELEEEEREKMQ